MKLGRRKVASALSYGQPKYVVMPLDSNGTGCERARSESGKLM